MILRQSRPIARLVVWLVTALAPVAFAAQQHAPPEYVAPPPEVGAPGGGGYIKGPAGAAPSATSFGPTNLVGGPWAFIGPAPTFNAQLTVPPSNVVCGAVQALAANPTNADILYIGAVNGGIWRTTNATAAGPAWTPLTDDLMSLSIASLEFDPTDATFQTLVAGSGRLSSFGAVGGARIGVLRTTNGGNTWSALASATFGNENLTSVAARSNILMAASDSTWGGGNGSGIFRSTNTGASFTQISGAGGTGLTAGPVSDLIADPANLNRFFAAVRTVGIFRSDDTGATWTNVTGNITGITASTTKIEMAMHRSAGTSAVYAGVLNAAALAGVWRSGDLGATWTQMDTPATGSQGDVHFSIVADPTNSTIVYVGGQAGHFRGNASLAPGSQFTSINGSGGGNTTPHADSREMVFDASGSIIEGDDGGVYRRLSPQSSAGVWVSVVGTLGVIEAHDMAYDSVAKIAMIGTQDNGTHIQSANGSPSWLWINGGDGGDVAVDDKSTAGQSIRYGSSQNLGGFFRRTYDTNNNLLSTAFPALTLLNGSPAISVQFATPVELNKLDPTRMIIGGANYPYESTNRGDSVQALTNGGSSVNGTFTGKPIAYGGRLAGATNLDILYYGSGSTVRIRTAAGGAVSTTSGTFPGGTVQDIVLDTNDWRRVFVADSASVFHSADAGTNWANITGNLTNIGSLHTVEFFQISGTDCVAVGTDLGVFISLVNSLGTWSRLGTGLPNVPVFDLSYSAVDNVLVAGTMGRGVFRFNNRPAIVTNTAVLVTESCTTNNGAIDPGETITVAFSLRNVGANSTSNLVATLLPGGGVTFPTGPQNYGVLVPNGAAGTNNFTFAADGVCGGIVTATFQLQDGSNSFGNVVFTLPMATNCCIDPNTADVVVTVTEAPDPVLVGSNLTYTLLVSNTGPATAHAVTVTNTLPAGPALVSSASSQGTLATNGGNIIASLGTLAPAATATITIIVTPGAPGTLTNLAHVAATEFDYNSGNNTAVTLTTVSFPSLAINDVSVTEGNAGTTNAVFTVTLTPAYGQTVTAAFATSNSTATAGTDYVATNGLLTFAPGVTSQIVTVVVNGDGLNEANEIFRVNLTNVTNGVFSRAQGTGTILNDDPLPTLIVTNISLAEGNTGTNNVNLNARLSAVSGQTITVVYATANGTATAGVDYIARSGTLTYGAGTTNLTVSATSIGDTLIESNETFFIVFSNAVNVTLTNTQSTVTITNDDGLPGQLDHFGFSVISSPQNAFVPFQLTLTAQDASNVVVTEFTGPAALRGAITSAFAAPSIVITEIEPNTPDSIEFMNAGQSSVNMTGWQIVIYDFDFYPAPTTIFNIPSGTTVPPGGIFRVVELGTLPGTYPTFNTGSNINWTAGTTTPIAVMVRDNVGAIVDFAGVAGGSPTNIVNPTTIPASQWKGATVTGTASTTVNYQRTNNVDSNSRTNWTTSAASLGATNTRLFAPFLGGDTAVTISAPVTGLFTNGVWSGLVSVLQGASNMVIKAGDGAGHTNASALFSVVSSTAITINDASVIEGNAGTATLAFTVSLTQSNTNTVSVAFATADGTATAGVDYIATGGTVTFAPGVTSQLVNVTVIGDTGSELDETVFVNLSAPSNAVLARAGGIGTILTDDPLLPLGDSPRQDFPQFNGQVNALLETNGVLYVGGAFTEAGQFNCGKLVPFGLDDGQPPGPFPLADRQVNAVVADGAGGWFAGGDFTTVGGVPRWRLVHLLADFSVDENFQADCSSTVNALLLQGTNLFVGGVFGIITNSGGATNLRGRFAVLDPATGVPRSLPSNPGFNSTVLAIAATNSTLYLGGSFTNVTNGVTQTPRARAAAIDLATGLPTAFVSDVDGTVNAIVLSGGTLYLGGLFATNNGQPRARLAAVDATSGATAAWSPGFNSTVSALAVAGNNLYVGGSFTTITNNSVATLRSNLTAVDTVTGDPTAWVPGPNGSVTALAVASNQIVAGGTFTNIGGLIDVRRIALLDLATGAAVPTFDPDLGGQVLAVAVQSNVVYAGGLMTFFNGVIRNRLAAVDAATGQLLPWDPNASSTVNALAASGTNIFAGGLFTTIAGQTRNRLAAIDTNGAPVASFAPTFSVNVRALVAGPTNLYVGGDFTNIINAGVTSAISGVAAVNFTNGSPNTNFAPNPLSLTNASTNVQALVLDGGTLYLGGNFTNVGGGMHHRLARLNATNGAVDAAWNPQLSSNALALAVRGTNLFVGGAFTGVTNTTGATNARNRLAAYSTQTGDATAWNPNASSLVTALGIRDTNTIAGGIFTTVSNLFHVRVSEITQSNNAPLAFNPQPQLDVSAVAVARSRVYVGGSFNSLLDQSRQGLAVFDPNFVPVLSGLPDPLRSFTENGEDTVVMPNISVDDINSAALASATVSIISNYAAGQDFLVCDAPPAGIVAAFSGGVLTLSGAASVAAYELALRSVTFTNNSENPATNARTIRYAANDGVASSAPLDATMLVTGVNDPPTISALSPLTTIQNQMSATVAFTVNDPDTDVNLLTLSFSSTDTNLVPPGAVSFGGSGASRTLRVLPGTNASGSATITVFIGDGGTFAEPPTEDGPPGEEEENEPPATSNSSFLFTVLADTDGDGMPDAWEIQFGLNPTNAADAALDADGDGMTNLQEYLAGTDPNDSRNFLSIISVTTSGTNAQISFASISGKFYRIERTDDVSSGLWTTVADNIAGNNAVIVRTDFGGSVPFRRIYRVRLLP